MNTRKITDMYFAATLLSYGSTLKDIDKTDERKQVFIFNDEPMKVWKYEDGSMSLMEVLDIGQVELLYRSKKLAYLPTHNDAIRDIKSMIYNAK